MSADNPRFGKDPIDSLERRVQMLEKQVRLANTRKPHLPLIDFDVQGTPFPQEGALVIDYTGLPTDVNPISTLKYGYGGVWHAITSEVNPEYEIKVIGDTQTLVVGDDRIIFAIPRRVAGYTLTDAQAYCTTRSTSGIPTIQLRKFKTGADLLSTKITIDVNEYDSYSAAIPSVINPVYSLMALGDLISVDCDVAGTGTKGLGVMLTFEAG